MTMKQKEVVIAVENAFQRMNTLYGSNGRLVFDEFLIVHIEDNDSLECLYYHGPRDLGEVMRHFRKDLRAIREIMVDRDDWGGNWHFVNDAEYTEFDAVIDLNEDYAVIFNNTMFSMDGIRKEGNWLAAQEVFLALAAILTETSFIRENASWWNFFWS